MRFEYPIEFSPDDDPNTATIIQDRKVGFYPIGRLNCWHGGVHVDNGINQIKAIADGKIIAYRFPENYKEEELFGKKYQYSNGFVLIQHDYESPKGLKQTFYSLYHHLLPTEEYKEPITPPIIFSKSVTRVTNNTQSQIVKGLPAISSTKSNANKLEEEFVISKGSTVELDLYLTTDESSANHWSKNKKHEKKDYRKVKYTDRHGKEWGDIFIQFEPSGVVSKIVDNKYIINKPLAGNKGKGEGPEKGTLVYSDKRGRNVDQKYILPKDEEVEKVKTLRGKWIEIKYNDISSSKEETGFVFRDFEDNDEFNDKDFELNNVKTCNIPIKAGENLGFPGLNAFERQPEYKASHIEVFTLDDPKIFLEGQKQDENIDDCEHTKFYYKIKKEASLKKLKEVVIKKFKLIKGTKITVIKKNGDYTKVKIGIVERTLVNVKHIKWEGSNTYSLVKTEFEAANNIFNGVLKETDKLRYVAHENRKDKKNKNRIVSYKYEISNETFWINTDVIDTTSNQISDEINELYRYNPNDGSEEFDIDKEIIVAKRKCKKLKVNDKQFICFDYLKKEKGKKDKLIHGWIEENDNNIKEISAFNWREFGFKMFKDPEDNYIYKLEETPDFLQKILKEIDTADQEEKSEDWEKDDKKGTLTARELQNAFQKPHIANQLSHLVCHHKSEWAMNKKDNWNNLKQEIIDFVKPGIDKATGTKKDELKKKRDERIDAMKSRVEELAFWYDVFPSKEPKVYHFHPFAFIEQMRRALKYPVYKISDIENKSNDAIENASRNAQALEDDDNDSAQCNVGTRAAVYHITGNDVLFPTGGSYIDGYTNYLRGEVTGDGRANPIYESLEAGISCFEHIPKNIYGSDYPDFRLMQQLANWGYVIVGAKNNPGGTGHVVLLVPEAHNANPPLNRSVTINNEEVEVPVALECGVNNRTKRQLVWARGHTLKSVRWYIYKQY